MSDRWGRRWGGWDEIKTQKIDNGKLITIADLLTKKPM